MPSTRLAALAPVATLALVGVLTGCAGSDDGLTAPAPDPRVPRTVVEGPVAATSLAVGDCLTGVVVGAAERARITSAQKVSCFSDHSVEIFAAFILDGADFDEDSPSDYPGQHRIVLTADEGCASRIEESFTDVDRYGLLAVWPTKQSWDRGDRIVSCAVFSADGKPFSFPQVR